jgi:hypothetical protein
MDGEDQLELRGLRKRCISARRHDATDRPSVPDKLTKSNEKLVLHVALTLY